MIIFVAENDYEGVLRNIDQHQSSNEEVRTDENINLSSTDQNQNIWNDEPYLKTFEFSRVRKLLVERPENNTPIDYFFLIADESFFNLIVAKTNKYAEEIFLTTSVEQSRITRWKPITVSELKIFLGLLLHMGTWKTNRIND